MPFYDWREENSGAEVTVFRTSLSEYNKEPSKEDMTEAEWKSLPEEKKWIRVVKGVKTIHPYGFTYKGNN
jgi:hypothetical protein